MTLCGAFNSACTPNINVNLGGPPDTSAPAAQACPAYKKLSASAGDWLVAQKDKPADLIAWLDYNGRVIRPFLESGCKNAPRD